MPPNVGKTYDSGAPVGFIVGATLGIGVIALLYVDRLAVSTPGYVATGVFCGHHAPRRWRRWRWIAIETEKRVREITAAHSARIIAAQTPKSKNVLQQQKEMDAGGVVNFSGQ